MKYVGKFNNVNNVEVKVTIITNNDSSQTTEITLADEPIVIETDSDGVFSPIKSRTCTIRMLSDLVYFDMYSATAKGVSVKVKEDASTIFLGYMTPNIYNLDFIGKDVIELEAVEAVSILKWYDYLNVSQNGVASLYDVLKYFLYTICGYTKLIVPKELKLTSASTADILNNIKILEKNFEEDDGDLLLNITTGKYEYKADKIKCYEVLEEICKFLNMTFTAEGKYAGIQSYPYIAAGNTKVWEYKFSNNDVDNENYTSSYVITDASFEDADTTISLTETYNRVNVEVDTYEVEDEVAPDVFNSSDLVKAITYDYDTTDMVFGDTTDRFLHIRYNNKKWERFTYGSSGARLFCDYSSEYNCYVPNTTKLQNAIGGKSAPWYNDDVLEEPIPLNNPAWSDTTYKVNYQQLGAVPWRYFHYSNKERIPAKADWNSVLVFGLGLPQLTRWIATYNRFFQQNEVPCYRYTSDASLSFGSATEPTYFVIDCSIFYSFFWPYPTDIDNSAWYLKEQTHTEGLNANWCYSGALMSIKIGNTYIYPTQNWGIIDTKEYFDCGNGISTSSSFHPFYVPCHNRNKLVSNSWMETFNTVEYTDNIDATGFKLTIPSGTQLSGKVEITLYTPYLSYRMSESRNTSRDERPRWASIKDFSVKYFVGGVEWFKVDDEKEDYSYFNVINDNYVLEGEAILLKINTLRDGFKPSYSSVLDANGNYLTLLYSKSLNKTQKQEYNIIETLVNHFNSPKKLLEITLPRPLYLSSIVTYPSLFGNTKFVVDSLREDLKNNTTTVNLIEL